MVVSFICWTITCAIYENSGETNSGAGYAQIPFIWIFGVFYALAWSGLLVAYALEILPYRLRGKGLVIMNITVQATLAVGGQTNPVAWKRLPKHWNLTLFYTVSSLKELPYECDANVFSFGSASNLSGSTSCILRQGDPHLRRSVESSMVLVLLRTSVWRMSRRRLRNATCLMRRHRRYILPVSSRTHLGH